MEKMYTVEEAAEWLSLNKRTLYNWIYLGKIKAVKINGATRIREQDLLDIIEPLETKKGE